MLMLPSFFFPRLLYFSRLVPLASDATLVVLTDGVEKKRPLKGPEREDVWALCREDMEPVATVGIPLVTAPDAFGIRQRDEDDERSSSCVEVE